MMDVTKFSSLQLTNTDKNFLLSNTENFQRRFDRRSLFRSRYEMENSVLRDSVHPTVDSKYWQAIGEQSVHVQELINLNFQVQKTKLDIQILLAKVEELHAKAKLVSNPPFVIARYKAMAQRKLIEVEELQWAIVQQEKVANARIKEIKNWEGIICQLEPQLKFGNEDFELHHPERYPLRTDLDPKVLPHSNQIDMCNKQSMMKIDPITAKFFNRKTVKIMVATPHRLQQDQNATDFIRLQIPAGIDALLEQPYGFTVPDARNFIVEKAISLGVDYIFFVDDDVILPQNALVTLYHEQADVIGGCYYRKYFPLESVPMVEDSQGRPSALVKHPFGEIIHNCLVLPSGCTLIKTDVFKQLEKPWYKSYTINRSPAVTEDTYICQKFRDINVDIILHTGIQCIHVDKVKQLIYGHPDLLISGEPNPSRIDYWNSLC